MNVDGNSQIPEWIDNFFTRWDRKFEKRNKWGKQAWKEYCANWADRLRKIDTVSLSEGHRRWVEWLLLEVGLQAKGKTVLPDDFEDNPPDWYLKVQAAMAEAYAPTIKVKNLREQRPGQTWAMTFGEMMGHEFAAWSVDSPGMDTAIEQYPETSREVFRARVQRLRPQKLEAVDEAVALAMKRPMSDVKQFFRGFNLALQMGTVNENGHLVGETFRTDIYYLLFRYPGYIQPPHINCVRDLYEWLQLMLGKGRVNDTNGFKRVEKICEDLRLQFGPPGRPRGS